MRNRVYIICFVYQKREFEDVLWCGLELGVENHLDEFLFCEISVDGHSLRVRVIGIAVQALHLFEIFIEDLFSEFGDVGR